LDDGPFASCCHAGGIGAEAEHGTGKSLHQTIPGEELLVGQVAFCLHELCNHDRHHHLASSEDQVSIPIEGLKEGDQKIVRCQGEQQAAQGEDDEEYQISVRGLYGDSIEQAFLLACNNGNSSSDQQNSGENPRRPDEIGGQGAEEKECNGQAVDKHFLPDPEGCKEDEPDCHRADEAKDVL